MLIRFRLESDGYNVGVPAGWWINNIRLTVSDWANVATVSEPQFQVRGHAVGSFCYRVHTQYPTNSGTLLDSPYSNVLPVTVESSIPVVNHAPVALLSALPLAGKAPLDVTLNGGDSSDEDGDALRYRFDFGDGSPVETDDSARRVHRYTQAGSYTARLVVIDSEGAESSNAATQTITVSTDPVTPPPGPGPAPNPGGSREGRYGGAAGGLLLAGLGLAAALRRRRRGT